ncbi:hypothetical protein Droror1_Dr00026918 [Drosera rotundifolia]
MTQKSATPLQIEHQQQPNTVADTPNQAETSTTTTTIKHHCERRLSQIPNSNSSTNPQPCYGQNTTTKTSPQPPPQNTAIGPKKKRRELGLAIESRREEEELSVKGSRREVKKRRWMVYQILVLIGRGKLSSIQKKGLQDLASDEADQSGEDIVVSSGCDADEASSSDRFSIKSSLIYGSGDEFLLESRSESSDFNEDEQTGEIG